MEAAQKWNTTRVVCDNLSVKMLIIGDKIFPENIHTLASYRFEIWVIPIEIRLNICPFPMARLPFGKR